MQLQHLGALKTVRTHPQAYLPHNLLALPDIKGNEEVKQFLQTIGK